MRRGRRALYWFGGLVLVAGIAVIVVAAIAVTENQAESARLATIDPLLRNGQFAAALARATEVRTRWLLPIQRATLDYYRGIARCALGRYSDGIRELSAVTEGNSAFADARLQRGMAYAQLGDDARAQSDYEDVLRLDWNNASAHYGLANLFLKRLDTTRALAHFDEAIRCEPEFVNAYLGRGECELWLKLYDRAVVDGTAALRRDPANQRALTLLSGVASAVNPPSQASTTRGGIASAQKGNAFALAPLRSGSGANEYYYAARDAEVGHDDERALELYAEYIRQSTDGRAICSGRMNRGNIFVARREFDRAMAEYDSALRADPGNDGAFVDRGLCRSDRGESDAALVDYNVAIFFNPRQHAAYYNRANEYLKRHRADLAIGDCNKAIELKQDFSEAYALRALCYARAHDAEHAAADVAALARLSPEKASRALNRIAWIQATSSDAALRDGDAAVDAARQACELTRWTDSACVDTLAAAYAESGDFDAAIATQEKAIGLSGTADAAIAGYGERLSLYKQHQPYRANP